MFDTKIWPESPPYRDPKQLEMEFLWPHNAIQLGLDLDRPEQPKDKSSFVVSANTGWTFAGVNQPWGTTTISNQLEVKVSDVDVGELTLGGLTLGLTESPKWYQRLMYKLLGFNWKDKQ
jgi:hypothetical protein